MRKLICLLVALVIGVSPLAVTGLVQADSSGPLVISEVQTGGCTVDPGTNCPSANQDPKMEFVELHSLQSSDMQVSGWKVQYVTSTGKTTTTLATLDGTVSAGGFVLIAHDGYYGADADVPFGSAGDTGKLASSAGYIQLVDGNGTVMDAVGWGSSLQAPQLSGWSTTAQIPFGYSVQRILPGDPAYGTGPVFAAPSWPSTPQGKNYTPVAPIVNETNNSSGPTCEGVLINELLPNPAGTDSGHEFIELYNPTSDVIPLDGCSLQTSANSKTFNLNGITLQPQQYQSLYNSQTGLTLENAAGGTVWLLSPTDELQVINYQPNLADNVAWARFGDNWQATYTPTPNASNALTTGAPCPAGQYRSTDTGRCRDVISASSQTACKPDQYRNPATNRCKSLVLGASTLTPCKAGQERNPQTNRCRAIGSTSSSSLKPCQPGWERNPATNRCRKATAGNLAGVHDANSPASLVTAHRAPWLIAGAIVAAALGYAIYEWRQEIILKYAALKSKFAFLPKFGHHSTETPKS